MTDHSVGSVMMDYYGGAVMSHSVLVAKDYSVGTVAMGHSAVAVITDHFVVGGIAVVFAMSHFAVATNECSEALSAALVPMKDHFAVALAMVDHSAVAEVIW